jgi:PAS domain S-box-containing protein
MFAGFLLGFLVLVGTAVLLVRSVIAFRHERAGAMEARGGMDALDGFLVTIEDAETGQRGYLLTGDTAYLGPYYHAIDAVDSRLAAVELTADGKTQRAALKALRLHTSAKLAELAETIRLRHESEQAAMALVRTGRGEHEMTVIRSIALMLKDADRERRDARVTAFEASIRRLMWQLALSVVLQFALAALVYRLTRSSHRRLAHEREFLVALLDNLADGVVAADTSGGSTLANRALREMYGNETGWDGPLARAVHGERVAGAALTLGARHLIAHGQPMLDSQGTQIGAVVVFRDVTQEHAANAALHASEERFRRLSDASTDGVAVSRDGVILEANAAFCRMFNEESLIGASIARLVAPDDRSAIVRAMRENLVSTHDLTCLRLDGTTFDGRMVGRPIVYLGQPSRIHVLRDITEWSRVSRLKNEFVSTVSHELRTPLTSINGALRLIDSGAMGPLPAAMGNLATIARTNCERLIRLVNDMLDLDKIEAGKLQLRYSTLAPADLVETTLDSVRAMADEYHVRLDTDVDALGAFSGDRDRVVQVLTNLVSNAVKFAPTDSAITVTARTDDGGDRIRFAVTNGGPGIAPSDMGRLFSKFQQIDGSDARRRGGTGLGLAIAKAIVEQHGGTIGVDSTPNVATTFWFELPIARAEASPSIAMRAE